MSGKQISKRITDFFHKANGNPISTSLLVLIVLSFVVIGLSLPYYLHDFDEFYMQVLAEAHGMLFDIAIIGILIFWLNNQGETRRRIRMYMDEIDDFRLWDSEEAAFRTAGNIKRLNRHKIYDLNLTDCHLCKTNLNYVNLSKANLNLADVSQSLLIGSVLKEARLNQTNFAHTNLNHTEMNKAYANGANFSSAFLIHAQMEESYLIRANFEDAILMEANLKGSDLSEANFKNANLFKADFRKTTSLKVEQLLEAKNLYMIKLDPELRNQLEARKPELIGR